MLLTLLNQDLCGSGTYKVVNVTSDSLCSVNEGLRLRHHAISGNFDPG